MEPYEVLALVRRFTPLLLAHLVLGAIAGYAVAAFSPPVFTSTAARSSRPARTAPSP